MEREKYSTNTKWENEYSYSRAVKVGNLVFVSGTTAVDSDDNVVGIGNAREQTKFIFKKIENSLNQLNAEMKHVVRTRMFVTDISFADEVVTVHGEVFKDIKPAATLVEVNNLIDDRLLVEIEVDAVINN